MKAQKLIAGANFGPEQLKAITKAFEDAWLQIAPSVSSRAEAVQANRLKLASIVLSVANRGTMEPAALTAESVKLMFVAPTEH